jgi:hypothetical protein
MRIAQSKYQHEIKCYYVNLCMCFCEAEYIDLCVSLHLTDRLSISAAARPLQLKVGPVPSVSSLSVAKVEFQKFIPVPSLSLFYSDSSYFPESVIPIVSQTSL